MRKFMVICLAAVIVMGMAYTAYAKRSGKYIGSAQCKKCHAGMHKALVDAYMKSPHHIAMADVATTPDAIVAVFDAGAPVNKADIKYVLGVGKAYQNYLDKDLKLLPGRWLVKEQKWVPAEAVDGATQCVGCHTTNFDPDTKQWSELGVGCESCHGPGDAHSESMSAADIVQPKKLDAKKRSMICGQCHSQAADPTGKYAFSVTFVPGNNLDEHLKLKTAEPGAQNSQYNDFVTSKHYATGMNCTVCHDSHGDKTKAKPQLKQAINDQCLTCHKATIGDMKKHAPTAKAEDTCATCHMPMGSHKFEKPK